MDKQILQNYITGLTHYITGLNSLTEPHLIQIFLWHFTVKIKET